MKRTPLSIGSTIQAQGGSSYTYIIDRVIGDGASSIVYEAHYVDNSNHKHCIRLKECYPYQSSIERFGNDLAWSNENERTNDIAAFQNGYDSLMKDQKSNYIVHAFDQFESNNTMYIVMDANEGATFDKTDFDSLKDILSTIELLAHVVGEYHQKGYLHLDIKPSNFLVYPRPSEHIVLFDVDSVTSMEDIASSKVKCVSYSKGWAAPEQMQGRIDKLCPATDIYSIGAILFQKVMGRAVENEDIGIFADWNFEGEMFEKVNPKIKRMLREIFKKTLAANIKRRYQTANELIRALEEAEKVAEQEIYLVNEDVFSEMTFIGREKNLAKMHDLFNNGTKAIFLHGFGGVGKTALARRFAELYVTEYDCVQFHRYTKDLATIIDDHMVNVDSDDQSSHRKQLRKICDNAKALIIIDNFDVEDDEDLEYLLSLNVNLIFTTRNDYTQYITSEKIEIVELESLPTKELLSIFKNEYGKPIGEDQEGFVEKIIEKFGNLTMLVPIVAKQILVSRISIEEFAESIEDDTFARFDEDSEDIRIRKDGKSQRTNSLDFIRAMFNIAGLSDKHKLVLRYLNLLKYHRRLTIKEYRRLTSEKNLNVLNDLQFRNWISFVDAEDNEETEIKVHQLIYDLVEKDDKPTYQNVPGIVSYIDSCFDVLQECISESPDESDASIDFEKAQCITYALLIYDDIKSSVPKEYHNHRLAQLYSFMCMAFLEDPSKTYKLLFDSPFETTYYFYVHGIMDMLPYKRILDWALFLSVDKNDQILQYETSTGHVEFADPKEKIEFVDWVRNELNLSDENFSFVIVPYITMLTYFYCHEDESDHVPSAIETILLMERMMSKGDLIRNTNLKYSEQDLLVHRLRYYLNICQSPRHSTSGHKQVSEGVSITTYYEFYWIMIDLLKKALCSNLDAADQNHFQKKAEEIIIMLEQQNEQFATYGLNLNDILAYTPLSVEKHNYVKQMHWSKKAQRWYSSVIEAVNTAQNPYAVYSLLLSSEYQREFVSNSKIKVLLKNNFIDTIYLDARLSEAEKKEILIKNVIKEAHLRFSNITKIKKKSKRLTQIQPTAELYYQALSKLDLFDGEWISSKLDLWNIYFVDVAIILRRLLGKEFFDINAYIESNISTDNIDFIGDLLYLADKLRTSGQIKKSKDLKNKILDLCLSVDFNELSEETIQMILYKIRPLAVNYKRDDVIEGIEKIPMSVDRKYNLALLNPQSYAMALKYYEPENIATTFMDDYINIVAVEAYNKMCNGTTGIDEVDDMEEMLRKYLDLLLAVTDISWPHYRTIFEINDEYHIRNLYPYWALEFEAPSNKDAMMGLCLLVAMSYDSVPASYKPIKVALDYLVHESPFQTTSEDLEKLLSKILDICPQAKSEVGLFLDDLIDSLD